MKKASLFFCCLVVLLGTFLFAVIEVNAQKLSQKEVPDTVISAFHKTYPKATVRSYFREKRNGKTVYEIESQDAKIRRDIIYSSEGIALEIEERVASANLPDPVKQTIKNEYPNGKIKSAERLTKGTSVEYEVVIRSGKSTFEVVLDTSGNVLRTEKP